MRGYSPCQIFAYAPAEGAISRDSFRFDVEKITQPRELADGGGAEDGRRRGYRAKARLIDNTLKTLGATLDAILLGTAVARQHVYYAARA